MPTATCRSARPTIERTTRPERAPTLRELRQAGELGYRPSPPGSHQGAAHGGWPGGDANETFVEFARDAGVADEASFVACPTR
jgi:hypothetical protein